MRVVGIDPGTKAIGYAVVDAIDDEFSLVDGGVLKIGSANKIFQLVELYRFVKNLINKFAPDVIVVEESFYGKNIKTLIRLAEMKTSILLAAGEESVVVEEYSPREIKLAITGYGNASKERISFMVSALVGIKELDDHNFSDAVAIALCSILRSRK